MAESRVQTGSVNDAIRNLGGDPEAERPPVTPAPAPAPAAPATPVSQPTGMRAGSTQFFRVAPPRPGTGNDTTDGVVPIALAPAPHVDRLLPGRAAQSAVPAPATASLPPSGQPAEANTAYGGGRGHVQRVTTPSVASSLASLGLGSNPPAPTGPPPPAVEAAHAVTRPVVPPAPRFEVPEPPAAPAVPQTRARQLLEQRADPAYQARLRATPAPAAAPPPVVPAPPAVPASAVVPAPPDVPASAVVPAPPDVPASPVVPAPPDVPASPVVPAPPDVPASAVVPAPPPVAVPEASGLTTSLPDASPLPGPTAEMAPRFSAPTFAAPAPAEPGVTHAAGGPEVGAPEAPLASIDPYTPDAAAGAGTVGDPLASDGPDAVTSGDDLSAEPAPAPSAPAVTTEPAVSPGTVAGTPAPSAPAPEAWSAIPEPHADSNPMPAAADAGLTAAASGSPEGLGDFEADFAAADPAPVDADLDEAIVDDTFMEETSSWVDASPDEAPPPVPAALQMRDLPAETPTSFAATPESLAAARQTLSAAPQPPVVPTSAGQTPEPTATDPREMLRASAQRAVERLVRPQPEPAPAPAPEPEAVSYPPGQRPSIAELTAQVERAVLGAQRAEIYSREVEQKAREVAASILGDAVTEAQRTVELTAAESESMLAAAHAEAAKRIADGQAEAGRVVADGQTQANKLISDAQAQADKITSDSRAQAEKLVSDARAQAGKLVSDGHTERDATIARGESHATAIVARAEVELGRRVRRIVELTDGIIDIAEQTADQLRSGELTGPHLAQFITALSTVTERALEHIEQTEQTADTGGASDPYPAQTTKDEQTDAHA